MQRNAFKLIDKDRHLGASNFPASPSPALPARKDRLKVCFGQDACHLGPLL